MKAQVHAIMGEHAIMPTRTDMFGLGGTAQLDTLDLPMGYSTRMESLRDLIGIYDREITSLDRRIAAQLTNHVGYKAIQRIHGVGPVLAAVFVAEIGDVTRFRTPDQLCCWAGLTPRHPSRTPRSGAGRSPKRNHDCCGGRRSRRSPRTTATATSKPPTGVSRSGGAATSAASPPAQDAHPGVLRRQDLHRVPPEASPIVTLSVSDTRPCRRPTLGSRPQAKKSCRTISPTTSGQSCASLPIIPRRSCPRRRGLPGRTSVRLGARLDSGRH